MITLILVRHGETDWNIQRRLAGSTNEPMLTDLGKKQSVLLAEKLATLDVNVVYCSKLKRAIQTTEIIYKKVKRPIIFTEGLNERSWGIYEGTNSEQVFKKLDKMDINRRFNYKPKGGESWKEFEKRILVTIEEIVKKNEGKTVVLVTHGGVIRALIPVLKKVPREISLENKIANNSLTIFKMNEGEVEEELINDISHLESI